MLRALTSDLESDVWENEAVGALVCLGETTATVLAYDYLLNIGDEAKYIWFSPLSLGKALYFLTRYSVIADMTLVLYQQFAVLDRGQCVVIFKTICYLFGIGTILTESVLILRTWVLWDRNKYIGATLVVGIVFCGAPSLYFLVQWVDSLVFANPLPHQPGCIMNLQKTDLFAAFIIFTGFESVILALTLMKYTRSWME
ncbi:hypothetical protein EUX98_g7455 [Antrodiella citrinella]|uniref:DUF6533 domain-containing protein n=1 Tax=Antrodiella citrinella TaxID=2447956 RepID=A0A4V3XHW9_9APHY|nr:hypothetical protein EUX98_g7455 [Antrodiella citrinella]